MENKKLLPVIMMLILSSGALFSCKKRTEPDMAGKGGGGILLVTPQHHGRNIDSCTVYIKYNTNDLPSSYDDSTTCVPTNGSPVATFKSLKKGKYYLFGKGWDPSIGEAVTGGKPYTITVENSQTIYLAVTEGD